MYGRGDHLSGTDGKCRLEIVGGRWIKRHIILWISKITNEAIGYGDSLAILILGIYLGIWGLLEVLMTAFFILGIIGLICVVIKEKERTCFSFLSISDSGISAWGMYRRNLRWRKESKGG